MNILIIGSTGSIGTSTCNCIRRNPDRFSIVGLATNSRTDVLLSQISEFNPEAICIGQSPAADSVRGTLPGKIRLYEGAQGLVRLVQETEYDVLVNALVGSAGLRPTVTALLRGKTVALANKESLVVGGELITSLTRGGNGRIIPIDSEHSAIAQCLLGERTDTIESLILTASGGPFRNMPVDQFESISPRQALNHPTWRMGRKITIDSATLMNKGFEVIEAHYLFQLPYNRLRVCIHPQSIIHSMVEFHDGAVMAQMGLPDMELPIQFALSYPERLPLQGRRLNLAQTASLTFMKPDLQRFPCLRLCIEAGELGGTATVALNAANEIAVSRFLEGNITFMDIPRTIEHAIESRPSTAINTLEDIEALDREVRKRVESSLNAKVSANG